MSGQPVRVLFVCLGNICRSPLAEGLLIELASRRGLEDRLSIDSAGTAAYHVGELADSRTRALLRSRGIEYDGCARRVEDPDFVDFDHILAMDGSNLRALQVRCPPEHHHKVRRMLALMGGGDVEDPYYGSGDGFKRNARVLDEALEGWLVEWGMGSD
jgi:protein-tyrosine phosphatase